MPKIADSGISNWKPDRLGDIAGKRYLITGGNSGIGLEAAKHLARAGGDVVIAARNPEKGAAAVAQVDALGTGKVDLLMLDLASLEFVRAAAAEAHERYESLDAVINNAGIMQTPPQQTAEGFEMQLGTNHLGHFLFAGLMLDLVEKAEGRIVVLSSIAHKFGTIYRDDLMVTRNYSPTNAYGQSKLANIMFAFELDRRLKAAGSKVKAIACHPGYSNTELQSTGPSGALNFLYKFLNPLMAQAAELGAIPTVLAAAGEEAVAGAYYGPTGMADARGPVGDAMVANKALDEEMAGWLWDESEKLVDFDWPTLR